MNTGREMRAARALLGMEQTELAKRAKVAIGTIRRMESFDDKVIGCNMDTLRKVTTALEKSGVVFLDRGVQMKAEK